MYIKVNASNEIVNYPYSLRQLKKDNPKVSFAQASMSDEEIRQKYGILDVSSVDNPSDDTKTATEVTPLYDGSTWIQVWETRDLTEEELTSIKPDPPYSIYL
tara:strand:- start:137 stop:442 length:306 start_codon:yes stop_codon:yes gene_type:complete